MRYIETSDLYETYSNLVITDKELWRNKKLREDFSNIIGKKCWYSEALLYMSVMSIDHFRPRRKVIQFRSYPYNTTIATYGYSWLENDYKNYRLSSWYSNSRIDECGKGNFFPIKKGSNHASKFNGMNNEVAMLLDPLNKRDVNLLVFQPDGEIKCSRNNTYEKQRVSVSTEIYNLNCQDSRKLRISTWANTQKAINDYNTNDISEKIFQEMLINSVKKEESCSATAIACIISNKANIPKKIYDSLNLIL